jgi:hypothetical protein
LCDWVLIFIFDIALEDCCSKSTDSCSISSQHMVWFSTSSAMASINSSPSESPVQILLIRHLNSQLSDRLSFMEYIKSPESIQKETPQKSKSLKLCSCPHKFRTPIIWHKLISKKPTAVVVCETGPAELPDLFTTQLLSSHVRRNRSSLFFC